VLTAGSWVLTGGGGVEQQVGDGGVGVVSCCRPLGAGVERTLPTAP
jgi:hypothetical protein